MKNTKTSTLTTLLNNPDRFTLKSDGWIEDKLNGIDIGPSSEETMDFDKAKQYCIDKGGRLPEIHELYSMILLSKKEPYSFPIFKDMKRDDWYWSGTVTPWNKNAYYCVSFNRGNVSYDSEDVNFYVRPVRACQ